MNQELKNLFKRRNVLVLGAGVEGVAMAKFALLLGAQVQVRDRQPFVQLSDEAKALTKQSVSFLTGSDYLQDLKHTDLIIRSPGISWLTPELVIARKSGVLITSQTELFLRFSQAKTIGVTGTKGKSTTASLIYHILKQAGKPVRLAGNLGQVFIQWLSEDLSGQIIVLELSSFQLQGISTSPNIAVVLEITNEHLDYHKNRKEYVLAKQAIVASQKKNDLAIINADSLTSLQFSYATLATNWWFSNHKTVDSGVYVGQQDGEPWFIFNREGQSKPICPVSIFKLAGGHNLSNAAAAITVAKILKISDHSIETSLAGFNSLDHRLQKIGQYVGRVWIDDGYATAPEATIAAIATISTGAVIIVGGSSKNVDLRKLSRKLNEAQPRAIILVGETGPLIRQLIENEAKKLPEIKMPILITGGKTMEQIIEQAVEASRPGDTILFSPACASFDLFKNARDRAEQFVSELKRLGP